MKQEIGSLLHLYLDEIETNLPTESHDFLINSAANAINEADGRNWIPVIVKQTGSDSYEVIANSFVFAAAEEAGLTKVWCIVADHDKKTEVAAQTLSQELVGKVDLAVASRDEIKTALDYLITRPLNPLKGVNLAAATEKIDAAYTQYWKENLSDITKLGCGITTRSRKKLNILREVFYVTPQPLPDVITDCAWLETFNATELKKMAKKRGFSGYSKFKKAELVKLLSTEE
ncbi:transcription termination factor rho family protein [[Limnothrix rosea] IAM M-220]|uniref:transcription termination factor rho family protein n=1 Tax=[Limnothrix rosea] IAM M-220 TaxID=454133 RepID=UPI00096739ED|nr:transcription termination factor rho family protein [[Limnothrix rosea] IAM M-220]OKH16958.1 transcription termination factor rho family protein [[Limnothrix rosea] IAM M-220]